ncbi:response regulator [Streptomyces massasporeus]|uniref:Response regulator n=1 Tax=Streptomyces massasporeus TaxID=67324 RepID=A0ABW6LFL5_9ACTN
MLQVLIGDDDLLLRSGLQRIFEAESDIEVLGTCDGRDTVASALRYQPNVVLVDLHMANADGLSILSELQRRTEGTAIAALTKRVVDQEIAAALNAGAAGYLLKDTTPRVLVNAVRLLASGGAAFSSTVTSRVFSVFPRSEQHHALARLGLSKLTVREREVLDLIPDGLSNIQIGHRLAMRPTTVKDHVSSILAKLGVANRVQAAVCASQVSAAAPDPGTLTASVARQAHSEMVG